MNIPESVVEFGNNAIRKSATVYCFEYSEADYWATDHGYAVVYLDDIDIESIREITLPANDLSLACGETMRVHANVFPDFDHPEIQYSSSNPDVAAVENGEITALTPGTATITAAVGNVSASMEVTCYTPLIPITVSFDIPAEFYVFPKETREIPVTNIEPEGMELSLTWSSADTTLATVDENGNVYGKRPNNEVVITATHDSGTSRQCVMHILPPLERLDVLCLPASLTAIEDEAFAGVSCQAVIIPVGCESIGAGAFAGCENLVYVRIPASVTVVADDAFEGSDQAIIDRMGCEE